MNRIKMKDSKTDGSTIANSITGPSIKLAWRLQRIQVLKYTYTHTWNA